MDDNPSTARCPTNGAPGWPSLSEESHSGCNDQTAIAPKHRDYSIDGDAIKAELDLPGTGSAAQRTRAARPEKVAYSASGRDLISADFQGVSFSTATHQITHPLELNSDSGYTTAYSEIAT
jgi:hypothetical protein